MNPRRTEFDLVVIGGGFAGLSAALFAAKRGMGVALAGVSGGGLDFCSGFIDLLGVHPLGSGHGRQDPWQALAELAAAHPGHPYARLGRGRITSALEEFCAFLAEQGLEYLGRGEDNLRAPNHLGGLKTSYLAPRSAWGGVLAWERKAPTLLVDFSGLKGFSARMIAANLGPSWPGLKHLRADFPGSSGELFPEHLARRLEDPGVRQQLAASLTGCLGNAEFVGFPALLGLEGHQVARRHLEELLGAQVFEVSTLPPSLPGKRIRAAFARGLPGLGVAGFNRRVREARQPGQEGWQFVLEGETEPSWPAARSCLLAGGRFLGGGLVARRQGILEPVFGLPVRQPESREAWTRPRFLDPKGHPVNLAGLEVDSEFRPLDEEGQVVHPLLRAAGGILAHNDWARRKCGAGLSIATAMAAVESLADALETGAP